MSIYRPRMLARLAVGLPTDDPQVFERHDWDVQPSSCDLTLNDHNHADELKITVDWKDAGIDPRFLANATVQFYLGDSGDLGEWDPTPENLRFVGRLVRPARSADVSSLKVQLDFQDYTSFFLAAKRFPADKAPRFSDTLDQVWKLICDATPGAQELKNSITFAGLGGTIPVVGKAAAQRFQKLGAKVPVKANSDSWAVWQQCVGMLGLISFFDGDQCVVTTAEDFYTGTDENPPVLAWGKNLLRFSEERNINSTFKGVGITSFDSLSGRALEARYPDAAVVKQKLIGAGVKGKKAAAAAETDYEYFSFPSITDQSALADLAKRVYVERVRQSLQGELETKEMSVETASGEDFDLLKLRAGDTLLVNFMETQETQAAADLDENGRIAYFIARGYSADIAQVLAANIDSLTKLPQLFFVKACHISLESSEAGGSFSVKINYLNKIQPVER